MKDLHLWLTNPFDDPHISIAGLVAFTTDHIQRMTANPVPALGPRIAATNTALTTFNGSLATDIGALGQRKGKKLNKNTWRTALPKNIGKIAVKVEAQFGEGSAEYKTCFPKGRSIFSSCHDDELANHLQSLVTSVTTYQTALGAPVVADATALLTGWNAVYNPSESSTGTKTGTQSAKTTARLALQLELFLNLQAIAQLYPRQPEKLDLYMQPSLLEPHNPASDKPADGTTPPNPPPAA